MYNGEVLKLNEEKNKILVKMNFLLEGLQDISDEDEKNTTLELINKLKVRLEGINKQIESSDLTNQQNDKQDYDVDVQGTEQQETNEEVQNQGVEEQKTDEEIQNQDVDEQDDYEDKETSEEVEKEPYTDEENTNETYDEEESEEDTESPKAYVGRKDNGNILGYYHRVKKQGK